MSMDKVQAELAKAETEVDKWDTKAANARAEAAELDRTAGAQILENPANAEKITIKVQAKEREARAYDSAASEARQRVSGVWRQHVAAEAREFEKLATMKRREVEKHQAAVGKLLDQLEALDGVRYEPHLGAPARVESGVYMMADDAPRETVGDDLEATAGGAAVQARLVRFVLEHGRKPLYSDQPQLLDAAEYEHLTHIDTPPVTKAALDAGVL